MVTTSTSQTVRTIAGLKWLDASRHVGSHLNLAVNRQRAGGLEGETDNSRPALQTLRTVGSLAHHPQRRRPRTRTSIATTSPSDVLTARGTRSARSISSIPPRSRSTSSGPYRTAGSCGPP